jgi:glutathione S-transferase
MIELFSYGSTNGHKVAIALEELGLPYEVRFTSVFAGEGQTEAFLALNPTGKIPVIRDHEADIVVTESDAILLYLADKTGHLVGESADARDRAALPASLASRSDVWAAAAFLGVCSRDHPVRNPALLGAR